MSPQFPIQNEGTHTAEFILSEANGHRSRGNAFLADPSAVKVGQPLKKTAEATTDKPATYVVATVGADCHALAIYGGVSSSGNDLRIAVLERDAEVNGRLIFWGSMSTAEQVIGATTLASKGIIVRL
ncbi:head decoration protein [Bradyrhizobium sp. BRP22]|uniref:head decoration protein n=1 Tax=Bradyrhizobium sp. BRP22 TaxID=2793821 RepID=UPI001CD1FDC4|nr:head decoration protein [Bradyrhizobium sp. BRP22]MCA1452846.1 head decoration protein [Bradyrhizobium sp. BRP22]